jgi:dipeptidyl-peptidase 4
LAELTAADVARYPLPGANVPTGISFSPDGRWLAFLWSPEHSLRRDLFVLDLDDPERRRRALLGAGGGVTEENLSLEERLRRERARDLGQGVTSASWAREGDARLLVPRADGLHVLDAPDFEDRLAVPRGDGPPLLDPQLSPDGRRVAFVRDDELCVADLASGSITEVTSGARGTGRTHGLAEFVAQEEMGRSHGFWWSPDGARLAFTEVDETHIPVYRIVHQGKDAVGEDAQEDHRYPFAGAENAKVRLGVVGVDGGDVVWADLGDDWEYLARVDWLGADRLAVQLEDRAQSRLDLLAVDAATGAATPLLTETSDVWINLHDALRPLPDGFLWMSERTGWRHLEVREADGSLVQELTAGEWLVDGVVAVGESRVWFTGTRDGHLERHLYEVPLAGGEVERLTTEAGTHGAVVHPKTGRWVDVHSSRTQPPIATLRGPDGAARPLLDPIEAADPRATELPLPPPELRTVTTDDGATIDVLLYRPAGGEAAAPYPTIVSVYGGPHVQQVSDNWSVTAAMRRQWLRSEGFLVVVADNRGAAGRGLAFEGAIRWDAGELEIRDQAGVVQALVAEGLADPERVGINGWSYGGYVSAMALAKAPETFKAAVAGAPVTHWDGYDTHYTERYLGTPQANPEGYARSSVMAHAEGMRDRHLMLVHGLIDENVHFRHTARLVNALIQARIPYELFLLPDERHSPRAEADRVYLEERILDFFRRTLAA